MITDSIEMVELLKALQQNPEAAAKALAASGLRPDQVLNVGQMGIGEISAPPSESPFSGVEPRYLRQFSGTAGPPQGGPPSDQFTLPAPGEVPMPKPVETMDLTQDPNMADLQWNQPLPIEMGAGAPAIGNWQTTATPAAAAGGPDLGLLMAGLKGGSTASADQKPIFGANAPAPKAMEQVKPAAPISMQAILQMLKGSPAAPQVPTIAHLMGGR